jgi:hypothetical protein
MIEKDFRALLPLWAVCAGALLATALDVPLPIRAAAAAVYMPACVALGAYAFGHEYVHGTMPMLLAQPMSRGRIYVAKLGVLALLLAALRGLLFAVPFPEGHSAFASLIVPLPILVALFLAPWLTLITRMPLAGALFSMGLAAIVLINAEWLALGGYGFTDVANPFKIALIRWTMLALCAIGAVMGWRTFEALEMTDGRGARRLWVPAPRQAAPREPALTRRSPVWLLVAKELRLQQMTLAVTGIYVGFYLLVALDRAPEIDRGAAVAIISAINVIVVSVVIGSIGSAEERHLGTLDWQLLLPMSTGRQWAVKVTFLIASTLLLTVALPALLVWLVPPGPGRFAASALPSPRMAAIAVIGVTASLYISSLVSNGLRALVTALPAMIVAAIVFTWLTGTQNQPPSVMVSHLSLQARGSLLLATLGALLFALLWLALSNHRTADRSWQRIGTQAAGIAAGLALLVTVSQALGLL